MIILPTQEADIADGLKAAPPDTQIFDPEGKANIDPVKVPPVIQSTSVAVNVKAAELLEFIVIVHPEHCEYALLYTAKIIDARRMYLFIHMQLFSTDRIQLVPSAGDSKQARCIIKL